VSPRTWEDQPEELERADLLLSCSINFPNSEATVAEIRCALPSCRDETWYLTTGSLFSSQTIKCTTVFSLLANLKAACEATRGKPVLLVAEAVLMKSDPKKSELRQKIERVLELNDSLCMDDSGDRRALARALEEELG
jgi:hypothetical protein